MSNIARIFLNSTAESNTHEDFYVCSTFAAPVAAYDRPSGCARFFFAYFLWFSRIRAKINENLREKGIIASFFAR